MKTTLPKDITELVYIEVRSSYTSEEILAFKNFNKFWDDIDVKNVYEEEWPAFKRKGIKSTYKVVYYSLKKALS